MARQLLLFVRSKYAFPTRATAEELYIVKRRTSTVMIAKDCLLCPIVDNGRDDIWDVVLDGDDLPGWVDFMEVIQISGPVSGAPDIEVPIEVLPPDDEQDVGGADLRNMSWGELTAWRDDEEQERADQSGGDLVNAEGEIDDDELDYDGTLTALLTPPTRDIETLFNRWPSDTPPSFGRRAIIMFWPDTVDEEVAARAVMPLRKRLGSNHSPFWKGRGILAMSFHDHRSPDEIQGSLINDIDGSVFVDHLVIQVSNVALQDSSGLSVLAEWIVKDNLIQRGARRAG